MEADYSISILNCLQIDDDLKKQQRPFLAQFFSPILLKVRVLATCKN